MNQDEFSHFLAAQEPVWPSVIAELTAGAKRSHWIWYVFPQIAGLGFSPTAQRYALETRAEALRYFRHPLLGARLRDATNLMLAHADKPIEAILGGVDAMKFRSSMTLFQAAVPGEPLFGRALGAFYDGEPDQRTLALLERS